MIPYAEEVHQTREISKRKSCGELHLLRLNRTAFFNEPRIGFLLAVDLRPSEATLESWVATRVGKNTAPRDYGRKFVVDHSRDREWVIRPR